MKLQMLIGLYDILCFGVEVDEDVILSSDFKQVSILYLFYVFKVYYVEKQKYSFQKRRVEGQRYRRLGGFVDSSVSIIFNRWVQDMLEQRWQQVSLGLDGDIQVLV